MTVLLGSQTRWLLVPRTLLSGPTLEVFPGRPRLQRSGSSPQQMTGTPRPPEPWTWPPGVGTGQGLGWMRGRVAIRQTAVVGEDAPWPEDRR